jgi:hypothetical protein
LSFSFSETELNILSNFAKINPAQIMKPEGFGALEPSNSIVAVYNFENKYDFEPFGIFEVPMFLQAMNSFDNPKIDIKPDHLVIYEGDSKIQFFTTPVDLLKKSAVPDVEPKFQKLDLELDFDLSADKLNSVIKTAQVLKAKYLYLESDGDSIRLTVSADKLESSSNCFTVNVRENIRSNSLGDTVLKIPLSELRVIPGDYTVQCSTKKITKWTSFTGVVYYIGCKAD